MDYLKQKKENEKNVKKLLNIFSECGISFGLVVEAGKRIIHAEGIEFIFHDDPEIYGVEKVLIIRSTDGK